MHSRPNTNFAFFSLPEMERRQFLKPVVEKDLLLKKDVTSMLCSIFTIKSIHFANFVLSRVLLGEENPITGSETVSLIAYRYTYRSQIPPPWPETLGTSTLG